MRINALLLSTLLPFSILACSDAAPGDDVASDESAITALGPEPKGIPTRHPIVLVHGFRASPTKLGLHDVAVALRRDGHDVFEANLPPHGSSLTRAKALASQLSNVVAKTGKVNIIAHSMGGLDARTLVSELGWGDRVASVTTIATPHRGSAFADAVLGLLPGEAFDDVVNGLADAYDSTYSEMAGGADVRASYTSLSEANAQAFQASHPDDPRVRYQSWAGVSNVLGIANPKDRVACEGKFYGGTTKRDIMGAQLLFTAGIVAHHSELRPNDGLVTVESAKWGTFRGCLPADHIDQIGAGLQSGTHFETGFDHGRFFRNVAFELAASGL